MMASAANKAIVKRMQNTRNAIIYNEKEKTITVFVKGNVHVYFNCYDYF